MFCLMCVVFLTSGCGVQTSSSGAVSSSDTGTVNTQLPVDTNTTTPPVDTNTTIDSIFDTVDAVLDSQACGAFTGFAAIRDNSLDPEAFYDETNGILLGSSLPLSFIPSESEVVMYRPNLLASKVGSFVNVYAKDYYISFDKAWVDNGSNTVYVKTPQDENLKYGCYRYELNSVDSNDINKTKVYR
jgi:hypothetical protein